MELMKFNMKDKAEVLSYYIFVIREGCRVTENKTLAFIRDFSERKSIKYLSDPNLYFTVRMLDEFISVLEEQLKGLRRFEERHDEAVRIENEKNKKHKDDNRYGLRSSYG